MLHRGRTEAGEEKEGRIDIACNGRMDHIACVVASAEFEAIFFAFECFDIRQKFFGSTHRLFLAHIVASYYLLPMDTLFLPYVTS